jgi:putative transposase
MMRHEGGHALNSQDHREELRALPRNAMEYAIFYVLRTGCAWRYLPREYPPWQTV